MSRTILIVLLLLTGCVQLVPPQAAVPRAATMVTAKKEKVWDAVIEVFAEMNIAIRTIDRASGFLAAEPSAVDFRAGPSLADCGSVIGRHIPPDRAAYNVLVRDDGQGATVKVTVAFNQGGTPMDPTQINCTSRGVWESAFEEKVKRLAESK